MRRLTWAAVEELVARIAGLTDGRGVLPPAPPAITVSVAPVPVVSPTGLPGYVHHPIPRRTP